MSELHGVGAHTFGGSNDAQQHARLTRELEDFAGQLNPDYRAGGLAVSLEDGAHGCKSSEDLGGKLLTEITFDAHRYRDIGFDERINMPFPSKPVGAEYAINSFIMCLVDSTLDFPEDVRAAMADDEDFVEAGKDPNVQYSLSLHQQFQIATNGAFQRQCVFRFNVGDAWLFNDLEGEEESPFGLPKQPRADVAEADPALEGLRQILGDEASAFLAELDANMEGEAGVVLQLFYKQIDSVRRVSRDRQRDMVRRLIRQIPVGGVVAADVA